MRSEIEMVLRVLWSQHLENACVEDCPYCRSDKREAIAYNRGLEAAVELAQKECSPYHSFFSDKILALKKEKK